MNCTKKITVTGYLIKYADLREPKPRAIYEDVYVLDKDGIDALGLLGLNAVDFITSRYEQHGYHVTGMQPIKPERVAEIDLCQLWEQTAPAMIEEAFANPDSEVHPE